LAIFFLFFLIFFLGGGGGCLGIFIPYSFFSTDFWLLYQIHGLEYFLSMA
jgi:hypothetical protein